MTAEPIRACYFSRLFQWPPSEEKELGLRRKGDIAKLRIAKLLREKTTMTLGWIAERLQMGTKTHLAHLLYWEGREKPK
jgi:hypothetical protein